MFKSQHKSYWKQLDLDGMNPEKSCESDVLQGDDK